MPHPRCHTLVGCPYPSEPASQPEIVALEEQQQLQILFPGYGMLQDGLYPWNLPSPNASAPPMFTALFGLPLPGGCKPCHLISSPLLRRTPPSPPIPLPMPPSRSISIPPCCQHCFPIHQTYRLCDPLNCFRLYPSRSAASSAFPIRPKRPCAPCFLPVLKSSIPPTRTNAVLSSSSSASTPSPPTHTSTHYLAIAVRRTSISVFTQWYRYTKLGTGTGLQCGTKSQLPAARHLHFLAL